MILHHKDCRIIDIIWWFTFERGGGAGHGSGGAVGGVDEVGGWEVEEKTKLLGKVGENQVFL